MSFIVEVSKTIEALSRDVDGPGIMTILNIEGIAPILWMRYLWHVKIPKLGKNRTMTFSGEEAA